MLTDYDKMKYEIGNNVNWRSNTTSNNYSCLGQNSNRIVTQNYVNSGARTRENVIGNGQNTNSNTNSQQQDNSGTINHINKGNSLMACPTIIININKQNYSALVDTGS